MELIPPTRFAQMRDGRLLGYVERGYPDGYPVLHHHGMPGSRLQHEASDEFYRAAGVRLITPDRPGYGFSDKRREGRLVDWPDDVTDLMDFLGVARFAVTGLSGGGIYALACGGLLPDRVTNIVVTGCPAPMEIDGAFRGMRFLTRAGVWLGRDARWLLRAGAWLVGGIARRNPRLIYERFNRRTGPDGAWISSPSFRGGAIDDLKEALRSGPWGYVKDIEALASPWGFPLAAIRAQVHLWHGDADGVIPPQHGEYLARNIPNAVLHRCAGEGHLTLWNHIGEVLAEATGPAQATAYGIAS